MLRDRDLVSVQEARHKVELAWAAFEKYRHFTQEQVDAVVEAMAAAGKAHAERLARMAVEETRYGNVKDKVGKNLLTSDLLARHIRGMKTVGVLRELPEKKIVEIAVPMGVVAALVPTTNPTSTVIFKSIISLKAGNAVVLSPHPRAIRCTAETADLMYRAAREAGAPEGIIQWLEHPTTEAIQALMRHERTAVILATGGQGMVRAAYSSGKPAFGVGPGNTPVLLDTSADLPAAVEQVVVGKAFDYGTVCTSEQALVCEASLKQQVLVELKKQKAFLCDEGQKQALAGLLLKENYRINPECVGQSPTRLAEMAGFAIPPDTSILVAEVEGVGKQHPLSVEKLSPVLALYFVRDFPAAMDTCEAVLRFGGYGHTCVICSKDEARIREFGLRMPAMRVLVNTAAPQGSTGVTTNLPPSMTLGCGAMAGNVTGDNIGPKHLINIKRIAYGVRKAEDVLQVPPLGEAAPVSAGAVVDRAAIAAAVEKYLAERGVSVAAVPARPAPAAGAAAEVVDRFLAARRAPKPPDCSTCALETRPAAAPVPPAQPVEPPKPQITITDFVCEADVRAALEKGRKIYIGPKTIVTPAARELAERQEVLVVAERK
ncbi:MAG: aldehyde dehydrogenase family protein [Acidobacteria bacterium]|nr:aldehyde dehydrogenase family protein [Acidobacteriota bacterium]